MRERKCIKPSPQGAGWLLNTQDQMRAGLSRSNFMDVSGSFQRWGNGDKRYLSSVTGISVISRQLPACHFHQFSHQPLEITPSAEWHREETDWAVSLHSQGCRREDAAAQLKDHTDTPGEEERDREGEKLAPLCVQDSSTATSCLEPWCRIANDHTGCSQQLFLIISIENSEIRHVLAFLGGGAGCRLQQAQGGGWKQGGEGSHQQRLLVTQQQGPAACPVWSCSSWWPINSVFSLIVSASRQHKGSVLDFGMDRM